MTPSPSTAACFTMALDATLTRAGHAPASIDTTVRGLVYEAAGSVEEPVLASGRELVAARAAFNEIPLRVLDADPRDLDRWGAQAEAAVADLLGVERES